MLSAVRLSWCCTYVIIMTWYDIGIERCSCLPEISRVAGAPDGHRVRWIRAEKQHLLAAQMHNHVKSHWSMHRHMARLPVVCCGALIWHADLVIFPLGFSSTLDLAPQIVPLCSCCSGLEKKKIKERKKKKGSGAQRMHKTVATFVFWKKKPQGFCILLCTGLSWKQTKVKSVIFPEKAEGLLYFPAHPRMNHHSQAAVGDNAAQFSAQIYI